MKTSKEFFALDNAQKAELATDAAVFALQTQGLIDTLDSAQERMIANCTMVATGDLKMPAYMASVAADGHAASKRERVADSVTLYAAAMRELFDAGKARTKTQVASRGAQKWVDSEYPTKDGKKWAIRSNAGSGLSSFSFVREDVQEVDNHNPEKPEINAEELAQAMTDKQITKATSEAKSDGFKAGENAANQSNAEAMSAMATELDMLRNQLADSRAAECRALCLAKEYANRAGATPAQKASITKGIRVAKVAAEKAAKSIGGLFTMPNAILPKKAKGKKAA